MIDTPTTQRVSSPARARWSRRLTRVVLSAALVAVFLRAALVAAIAFAPNAAVWGNSLRRFDLPPALAHRQSRAFDLPLDPNVVLSSWIVEPARGPPKGTVILLHGVRMDKRSLTPMGLALSDAGYRAVLIDLPGHGASSGRFLTYGGSEPRLASRLLDALSASGLELGPVGVYGFSYGAAVAIDLGARDARVQSVVAVSAFSSLRDVMNDYRRKYLSGVLDLAPDAWFQSAVDDAALLAGFDADASAPARNIAASGAHILLIHGDADTQVPLRHSQNLVAASHGRAGLVVIPGATHEAMPVDASRIISSKVVAWFDDSLRRSAE